MFDVKTAEDNATPLYDFLHSAYFNYNWIPILASQNNCSDAVWRFQEGCQLWVLWSRWQQFKPLQYIPPAGDGSADMELTRLSSFVNHPDEEICKLKQSISGNWLNSLLDGTYYVCLDNLLDAPKTHECLVYSMGIRDDWSFDEALHKHGCEVHAFDPSIDKNETEKRGDRHWFHKWGLATSSGGVPSDWKLYSFPDIQQKLGHTGRLLNVLKMDVEGAEWTFLSSVGVDIPLDSIDQIIMEIHEFGEGPDWAGELRKKAMLLHQLEKWGFVLFNSKVYSAHLTLRSLNYRAPLNGTRKNFFYELSFLNQKYIKL
ncbi:hypothetical protein BV898_14873 [Hypsibius exemplaris]|uniref:Methyltransferase domain-containing protein n=1 Tax=Hypsibius exemplaris TaxID=2072580 RepID=A0A9X6NBH1_HYPEX|nr:hypothetical protein BV898_14873 [Hypsibius exemplaris]